MPNSTFDDKIRARIQLFTEELTELIRQSALENLRVALAAPESGGRGRRRGAAALIESVARRGKRGAGRATERRAAGRAKGAKRDPGEIAKLTDRLSQYIKDNPGQRIEQIASGLGAATKDLTLPAKKLIASKQIKTRGQKRATQYFAR